MKLFRSKTQEPAPAPVSPELADLSELNELNKIFDNATSKNFDFNQFQCPTGTDSGNYFGSEFDIRATVGRLKTLYLREPWVYATASLIARTLSTIPFAVKDKVSGEVIEEHPLNQIINKGNYLQDKQSRDWVGYLDLVLAGNFFLITDEDYSTGIVVPVENVTIKPRTATTPQQRELIMTNGPIESVQVTADQAMGIGTKDIPYEQVIHFKLPNPFNPLYGMSMYAAAARPILLDRYKNEFEMAFYLRGATNSGVIETEQEISRQRMERLMRTFEQAFTGKRNWWRTLFLPKGAKWVSSSMSMSEMQHLEGLRENRRTLLAVLGIPPSMVGIVEDVNRATSEVQQAAFWHNTILPLAQFVAAGWNSSYLVRVFYEGAVEVVPVLEGIPALEGSLQSKAELANAVKDWMLVNEVREQVLGIEALPPNDPRGQLFAKEITAKVDIFGSEPSSSPLPPAESDDEDTEPTDEPTSIGDEEQSTRGLIIGITEDGDGDYRHLHAAEWDSVFGNGNTTDTQGNGPKHGHVIKEFAVLAGGDDSHRHPDLKYDVDSQDSMFLAAKKKAVTAQDTIEKVQGNKFYKEFIGYLDMLLSEAAFALRDGRNVSAHLLTKATEREQYYLRHCVPILIETMDKGFSAALTTAKSYSDQISLKALKELRFDETDQQAIDAIRERTKTGKRKQLADRSISKFYGIDKYKTEQVMQIIEDGLQAGETTEQVAKTLANTFGENYQDQAFTIVRTETLSAISEGNQWNHETLKKVFTVVNKQWFHVGDVLSNPDARKPHAGFENEGKKGVVPSEYVYQNTDTGGKMLYPRDPSAGAADVINCRCSMVTVIPPESKTNSELIVNT